MPYILTKSRFHHHYICRYTLNKPRTRCIVSDEGSSTTRLLLLTDEVIDTGR